LPFYTHDLLKKMLEKNPNNRKTATAALKHPALHTDMEV
jgi:serine/threonine protein kinase